MSRGKHGERHIKEITSEKRREWHYKCRYNITIEEYDRLLDLQNGHCALCPMTPEMNGKRLYIDHNHTTKKIRGLLCIHCNALVEVIYSKHPNYSVIQEYLKRGL